MIIIVLIVLLAIALGCAFCSGSHFNDAEKYPTNSYPRYTRSRRTNWCAMAALVFSVGVIICAYYL